MIRFEKEGDFKEGALIIVNKPLEWTSFDVVNKVRGAIRRVLNVKKIKVGHAGTLDPLATGIVVLCTGKYTKRIEEFQAEEKEYITTLKLGATTPSFDAEKEEDATFPYEHITEDYIREVLPQFTGLIEQVPPMYSAVKINGKRAYRYARSGKEVELKAKQVEVKEIELLKFEGRFLHLRIVCGKGTYIRSIARDLGFAMDSGAYLTELTRTRVGHFTLEDSSSVAECMENIQKYD